jgi:hypothetical protein
MYPSGVTHPNGHHFEWSLGRTLPDFHLIWIASGKGEFQLEDKKLLPLPTGSVLLLPPGTWHRYRPMSGSIWTEYWVDFNGDFACELVNTRAIELEPRVITNIPPASMAAAFEQLMGRLMSGSECAERLAAADAFHLLALVVGAGKLHATETSARKSGGDMGLAEGDELVFEAMAIIRGRGPRIDNGRGSGRGNARGAPDAGTGISKATGAWDSRGNTAVSAGAHRGIAFQSIAVD